MAGKQGEMVKFRPSADKSSGLVLSEEQLERFGEEGRILKPRITYKLALSVIPPKRQTSLRTKVHELFQENPSIDIDN